MAQKMALNRHRGAFTTTNAAAPRAPRCIATCAVHREQQVPLMDRLAPTMLAGLVSLSAGFTAFDASFAPPARADSEEEMSPYQKRQAELERRRELLREAREKAAARAELYKSTPEPAAAPAAPAPAAPAAPSLSDSLQSYQAAAKKSPSMPAAAEPEAPSAPAFGGFSWSKPAAQPEQKAAPAPAAAPAKTESSSSDMGSMFSSDMWNTPIKPKAAAPEAAAPAPTLAPTPAPAPFKPRETPKPKAPEPAKQEVKKQEVKKQAAPSKPGKRRGPLPLWFAEILALGAYVGLFLAVTKYSQQSSDVLRAVADKVVEAYKALDKLINKNKQQAA